MTFLCGGPPTSGPRLYPVDYHGRYLICCTGAWLDGAPGCTCWVPAFDREQQRADPDRRVTTRSKQCVDCAYRPDSPEMKADPYALLDLDSFWCHQGMRRPKEWRHPDGRVRPGDPGDYQPPMVGGVAYRADGHPAQRCAGWARHRLTDE